MVITVPKNWFRDICNMSSHYKKFLFILMFLILFYSYTNIKVKNHNFDYFVFSQRWLPTSCIEYMEHSSSNSDQCVLPQKFQFWTIHGLWPTGKNHMGPFFCNKSMPFDVNELLPIQSVLKSYWPNIEAGKSMASLWQHEWEKHGTCAAQIKMLNSEFKYFNVTLNLYKNYNIQEVLKNIVVTNGTVNLSDIFFIINDKFKKQPRIHCIHEVKINKTFLSEIHLCYSKSLELINCGNMVTSKSNSMLNFENFTDCPLNGKIYLPYNINPQIKEKVYAGISEKMNAYKAIIDLLKFLMWVSI